MRGDKYIVISQPYYSAFEQCVNDSIADGYEPIGGVAIELHRDSRSYYQAMVRRADNSAENFPATNNASQKLVAQCDRAIELITSDRLNDGVCVLKELRNQLLA
jgi:hypothetical protein